MENWAGGTFRFHHIITMKHLTNSDININLDLVEIMRDTQRQHGTEGLIDCIIEFCCENVDFTFEDAVIARLQKFKADNQ